MLVFEPINEVKEQETKFLSLTKFPFRILYQAKGQGPNVLSRHRNLPVLVFEVRKEVKGPETKILLSHGNLPF